MADRWTRVKRKSGYGYVQVNDNNQAVDYDSQTGRFRVFDQPNTNSRSYMTEFTDQSKNEANRNPNYTYNVTPMDEVTVTAKKPTTINFAETSNPSPQSHSIFDAGKEFHYSDPSQYRSAYDKEAFGKFVYSSLLNLSPTQWAGRLYNLPGLISGNMSRAEYIDQWINGNNGIVSDEFAQEHPYWATGINSIADVASGVGVSNLLSNIGKTTTNIGRNLTINTQKLMPQMARNTKPMFVRNPTTGKFQFNSPQIRGNNQHYQINSDDFEDIVIDGLTDDNTWDALTTY